MIEWTHSTHPKCTETKSEGKTVHVHNTRQCPPERLNLSCERNSIPSCKKRIFEVAKEYPAEKIKSLPKTKIEIFHTKVVAGVAEVQFANQR